MTYSAFCIIHKFTQIYTNLDAILPNIFDLIITGIFIIIIKLFYEIKIIYVFF